MRFSEDRIESLICSDKIGRNIHIWEPEQPKVIFLAIHGAMGHAGDYVTSAVYFKQHDIATIAPELHGHDQKKKVHIPHFDVFLDDLELMIAWIRKRYQGIPLFIIGNSMGALIATHFGIRRLSPDHQVKGLIFTSPYFVNSVKAPPFIEKIAGMLSMLLPNIKIPLEDYTSFLTHDLDITNRHRLDEKDHIRATQVSARFASELLKAQAYIPNHISKWDQPLFCAVAGDDRIADASTTIDLLKKIAPNHLSLHHYQDNYHENFNELNREEIFSEILTWINNQL